MNENEQLTANPAGEPEIEFDDERAAPRREDLSEDLRNAARRHVLEDALGRQHESDRSSSQDR
jgi:hypothetical protein